MTIFYYGIEYIVLTGFDCTVEGKYLRISALVTHSLFALYKMCRPLLCDRRPSMRRDLSCIGGIN